MTYIPPTGSAVNSVFGRIGDVTANASDYSSSQINNDSGVPGTFVEEALDNIYGRLPFQVEIDNLMLGAFPNYTTVLSLPLEAGKAYSAVIFISIADDPVTNILSGMWRFLGSFHRNIASGATLDGDSVTFLGNFPSARGQFLASGNNVLVQVRVRNSTLVNARIDARIFETTPG